MDILIIDNWLCCKGPTTESIISAANHKYKLVQIQTDKRIDSFFVFHFCNEKSSLINTILL